MEGHRGNKDGEKREDFMGLKLNNNNTSSRRSILVGKSIARGGFSTPPPTWTFEQQPPQEGEEAKEKDPHFCSKVTARQLGANLWEVLPHLDSLARMSHHHRKTSERFGLSHNNKNKGLQMQTVLEDLPGAASDEQAVSTGSFHREIAASLMRHHRAVDRSSRALQPVSPASYGSSLEITPYNPAATPSSSVEYKGTLKTSTELLKVLNRIWYLEEQQATNVSRVKALKIDLDNGRSRIKELLKEKQMDRQVIDDLMKQVSEHKHVKKNVDQERVQSALQSAREELEDERKLRKRSESLHRKLVREISEMKSTFSKVLNDLERERRARILLEDLCDEFAMGIRDYEQELRSLKHRTDKEQVHRDHVNSLVLHISEAWLDERVQMKLAEEIQQDGNEKSMIVDKLRPEIETFLKTRQALYVKEHFDLKAENIKRTGVRRQSLESLPLNEAKSAPQDADDDDDDDSIDSDSNCFELNNAIHSKNHEITEEREHEETVNAEIAKRKGDPHEANHARESSSLQARFEKHMANKMISTNSNTLKEGSEVGVNSSTYKTGDQETVAEEGSLERRSKRFGNRFTANKVLDNILRHNSSTLDGERIYPASDLIDDSHGQFLLTGPASPVKRWDSKIISHDPEISESSSRWPKSSKENSLKAKLLEARLEARLSKLQGSRGSAPPRDHL